MRPICFYFLISLFVPVCLVAQDPVATALRIPSWPETGRANEGIGWSAFSRQYYCISNWNATGLSASYFTHRGQSTVVLCRDGIPRFSWYHLYLSHFRQFKALNAMLQLRFSLINLNDQPPVFRLGGNILTTWSVSQTTKLQVRICDFPGWILPSAVVARGDPLMDFLFFHEPDTRFGLAAGFSMSRALFGPVTTGIRMKITDQLSLLSFLDVMPLGVSVGISWKINGYVVGGWLGHRSGLGLTPFMEVGGNY